jgi:hypothetical protein
MRYNLYQIDAQNAVSGCNLTDKVEKVVKMAKIVTNIFSVSEENTALSIYMRYTMGGQDAHPTRILSLISVPHNNGNWCKLLII